MILVGDLGAGVERIGEQRAGLGARRIEAERERGGA
jgi:hypothetical protein